MRQFILTIGTIAAVIAACWYMFQGISSIIRNELEDSFFYLLLVAPILLSMAATFDYVNSALHADYRRFRKSMARKRGAQGDIFHADSKEVIDTPWEDDSSHTR